MSATAPQALAPEAAHTLIHDEPRSVFIDVRSSMEYLMVGHPVGAVHIAWLDEPDWVPNPRFIAQVRELMLGGAACADGDCPAIILICRSGRRSLDAGQALTRAGFKRVFYVSGGFEGPLDNDHHRSTLAGWRFENLPWEQC
ncbi:rhodanese-like domain-containing protein [Acidihalobacter ferrooxydans]|uniref:Sulfurtransferase n=1 Tax=Acidihalobacter ferrooxydans TaxID=1765967 RepID=A0A1P8UK72_9GAMM|nr:rhodanese-like domain-containing protein [Acidihalobacter ferrooxydans]APZ44230.1 sulfurtransferase [Acidihalobacter ferrooxydans]